LREGMRRRTYLLLEDAQPRISPAPPALVGPPLHGVRAPPLLLAPLVDPRPMPCCVAPKTCEGPLVKTLVCPRLTNDNLLSGVRFFFD